MTECTFVVAKRCCLLALTAALLVATQAFSPVSGLAAGGGEFALPINKLNPSGLKIKIDGRGIDANGYRPVHLEISPTNGKPWTFDRELRVVLSATRMNARGTAKVSQIIELPEGSALVQTTILVPQSNSWLNLSVETYEGGENLPDLSYNYFRWPNNNGWQWTEARPAMLFIHSQVPKANDRDAAVRNLQANGTDSSPTFDLPDVRTLLTLFPDLNSASPGPPGARAAVNNPPLAGQPISDTSQLALIATRTRIMMLPPAELPTRWIEWSQFDVAVILLDDLRLLAKSQPPALAALRDWVSTGPLLIVYGVGQEFAQLEEVEQLLELPALSEGGIPRLRNWLASDAVLNRGGLRTPFDDVGVQAPEVVGSTSSDEQAGTKSPAISRDSSQESGRKPGPIPFVYRHVKLGRVVAIAHEQPFPGTVRDWSWLFNAFESHWKWFRRTGMSLSRPNDDYWKLLVPGVGKAPAKTFLFLVSVFAVAIGPLNFWLLGRARRHYLMVLTVPVGAGIVTLGLFAFAVFADGLGTRLRLRSFTDLDQSTGRAAVWSRHSYYAAMAPSQGLVFPDDTIVFPLVQEPRSRGADRSTLITWDGNQQQLRRGFLNSRTATQFVLCRATTSPAKLLVNEANSAEQPPSVENQLNARIQYLLLRDKHGNYFVGQALSDKATQTLTAIELADAATELQKLAKGVQPLQPDGYDPDDDNNLWVVIGGRRWRMSNSDSAEGNPVMSASLLETNIAAAIRPNQYPLLPGTYVAVTESSPLVITGLNHGREEAGFHVIRGKY